MLFYQIVLMLDQTLKSRAPKSSNSKLHYWHFHTAFASFQKWTQGMNGYVIPHQLHANKWQYNYMIKNEFYLCFSMHEIYILPAWFVNKLWSVFWMYNNFHRWISHKIAICVWKKLLSRTISWKWRGSNRKEFQKICF